MNDNLNGVERPVSFDVKAIAEIQWRLCIPLQNGSVWLWQNTDLKWEKGFIRHECHKKDEDLDNLHSIYVDQWTGNW